MPPNWNSAIASSSSSIPSSCSNNESGCWIRLRRVTGAGLPGFNPEAQRGNHLFAARAVEQVERDRERGDRAEEREELAEAEIQKFMA